MVERRALRAILVFWIAVSVVLLVLGAMYVKKQQQTAWTAPGVVVPGGMILYYGTTCPHCHVVQKFMNENNLSGRLGVEEKEVYENEDNAAEMVEYAKKCGITEKIGIPFLVTNGSCFVGQDECIRFLKSRGGIS